MRNGVQHADCPVPTSMHIPFSATPQGAWVALLECDYVWMKPLPSPGDAYTSNVPGWQYHFGEGPPLRGGLKHRGSWEGEALVQGGCGSRGEVTGCVWGAGNVCMSLEVHLCLQSCQSRLLCTCSALCQSS